MNESADNGKNEATPEPQRNLPVRNVRFKTTKFLMPASRKDAVPHYFTAKQVKFLEVYATTLDVDKACEKSGLTRAGVRKSAYLNHEIKQINQAAMFKHRSKASYGNHLRLMDKFEKDYDTTKDHKFRASVAGTLAKMSEANMKAAGEFKDKEDGPQVKGVRVILNMPGLQGSQEPPTVDVEAVDSDG